METIHQVLNGLYTNPELLEISADELLEGCPAVMDEALENTPASPFKSYEESLIYFSRAIYQLHLEGGRSDQVFNPTGASLYDPNEQYAEPVVEEIEFSGKSLQYDGGIGSSYGVDFIDVTIDPANRGESLSLEFEKADASPAEFSIQVWKLGDGGQGGRPHHLPLPEASGEPEVLTLTSRDGKLILPMLSDEREPFSRLGLVITRLDNQEATDSVGAYSLSVRTNDQVR